MPRNSKTTYAKSSDIKGRSYLEYRRDMKRKAIVELDARPWIENVLSRYYNANVRVEKSGGDRFLWFLRTGGISREPDFIAHIDSKKHKIEFQYASIETRYYDFKISKVSTKRRQERVPKEDLLFIFIDMPSKRYALLSAKWIVENAEIGEVAAWRSSAYRVPAESLKHKLQDDPSLEALILKISHKLRILDFQHKLYDQQKEAFREKLEASVLGDVPYQVVPSTLEGLYEACFILQALEKYPQDPHRWIERAQVFQDSLQNLQQAFQLAFCVDFLYFSIPPEQNLDTAALLRMVNTLRDFVRRAYDPHSGAYIHGGGNPCEETQCALFVINLLEDIIQDMLHYRRDKIPEPLRPNAIRVIYQTLNDPDMTGKFIQSHCVDSATKQSAAEPAS